MATIGFGQLINEVALIKAHENDSIYLVFHRELHHIPSINIFNELFIPNAKVESRPLMELETLPKGIPLYNAQIIKGESSAVFLAFNNCKIHVGNTYTFKLFQFDWGKIKLVKSADISRLKTLHPIESYQKEKKQNGVFALAFTLTLFFVLGAGLEPARPKEHRILSPACLPIPPSEHLIYRTDKSGNLYSSGR